tara:strand:+ start:1010 stop:1804 length:795 start_codon:yes stop_codon:yes gene_type:complete
MTVWLKDYVADLPIAPEGRLRMDCPACGKKNTFSVSDTGGERLWFCFHADCGVRGRTGFRIRKDAPTHPLLAKKISVKSGGTDLTFELPDTFVPLSRSEKAVAYLKRVNAYRAYQEALADIRYDFRMDRVVYLIKENNRVIDAAGRGLAGQKPKWWRYGNSGNPFICGRSCVGVVMEDCASACSVSDTYTGIALLGTNLLDTHLPILKNYDKILVALDKDATVKALQLVRKLQSHVPTSLVVLNKDLKDMTNDERRDTFKRHVD